MSDLRDPVEPRPGVFVHSARDRELASVHWLLSAAPAIEEARREWAESGIAVLRCGGLFTAIRISALHRARGCGDGRASGGERLPLPRPARPRLR